MTLASHILVVEDDAAIRKMVFSGLTLSGYEVTCCANGQEALTLCATSQKVFDLIIMDIQMPVMNGIDAAKLIRRCKGYERIPIICLSGEDLNSNEVQSAGFTIGINKPFSFRTIKPVLEDLLLT